ncbi:LppU/SCO3897 family protein [Lentzea flava]|uniref:Uncharacterized protein n=1 Tax=Lentzea flava TaxID=103732 RepID=A0ABQ2UP61_9PSEU|nr:hypothetical protein [Lentzea flava]GGU46292.1 hypothetical protein GCM10010178_43670 [Lentzea flava]
MNEETAAGTGLGKRVLTYAATLLVAAVAIYGISEFLTPVQPPKKGDCASLTGTIGAGRYRPVDCSDSSANYVAEGTVARSQSCPNSDDLSWVPVRAVDPDLRFCLVPLYVEGECYTSAKSGYDLVVAGCGEQDAFRVTVVSRNVPAPACGAGAQIRAYPEIKLSYCLSHA